MTPVIRCSWTGDDPLYIAYHDQEWGVAVHDSQQLFEKLILDGFQAGLSWITILRKRDNFLKAFDGFDPERIAQYDDSDIERLMKNTGIIRNRLKIKAAITSSQAYLRMEQEQLGSFSDFIWSFTEGKIIRNSWDSYEQPPTTTPQSEAMSKALKKKGFKFCGPTICYAFMQAVGIVNDHNKCCFRHGE